MIKVIIISALLVALSCSGNRNKKIETSSLRYQDKITLENLQIPKKWIEIPNKNPNQSNFNKTKGFNELRTVLLTKIQNKDAIEINYGYESQWFEIKKIIEQKDSLIFDVVLPFDTTEILHFSMKYNDRDKFIARWVLDGFQAYYFPFKDTIGNNRVTY